MIWAAIAAAGVTITANLPLLYSLYRFNWSTFTALWKLAPHQFFFGLFCVPVAVWFTCIALWWVLVVRRDAEAYVPVQWRGILHNWPVIFLAGIALAATMSAVFFLSTTWSPDKLRGDYPANTVTAISAIESNYSTASTDVEKAELDRKKAQAGKSVEQRQLTDKTIDTKFQRLTVFEQAEVAIVKRWQDRLRLTDEAAIALSAFQVLGVVAVAAVLLLTCGLLFLLGHYAGQAIAVDGLRDARLALLLAILAFVPYPFLYGLYRSELERAVRDPGTGGQEFVALVVILVAIALVLLSEPEFVLTSFSAVWGAAIALLAVASTFAPKLGVGGFLRQLVGFQSSLASQVGLVIVWGLLVSIAIIVSLPRTP